MLKKSLKVGDKIVEGGRLYRVFEIKKRDTGNGETEKIICYRPYFKSVETRSLICSIPIKNLTKTKIRKPLKKRDLLELLKAELKKPVIQTPNDINKAKDYVASNNPKHVAKLLKCMWLEKGNSDTNFTKSKKDMFELAIKNLEEEVAYVNHITLEKAREKITETLKNYCVKVAAEVVAA